jgi:hypothetical protein
MLASLRYLDTFVKIDGAWLCAERRLYIPLRHSKKSSINMRLFEPCYYFFGDYYN